VAISGIRVAYYGIYLSVNSLQGNIIVKAFGLTTLELTGAFFATYILKKKFNIK
jgi:hypothetical protein